LSRDFTLARYGELLETLQRTGYRTLSVGDFLAGKEPPPCVVLRHDVDRPEERALTMALLEKSRGIRSSYYFRIGRGLGKAEVVRRIKALGHEVGYHYEVLSKAGGDREKARKIFEDELSRLRQIAEVRTAAMHGWPLSPWNNLAFWETCCPEEFGLTGEAYLSFGRLSQAVYLSDTGRAWNSGENLRDRFSPDGPAMPGPFFPTGELIRFLGKDSFPVVYLLVHPNRWTSGTGSWFLQWGEDAYVNWLKRKLKRHAPARS
jgi:hypothetical protein